MWEQLKWAVVESSREVCSSVRVGLKNPKSVICNDWLKAAVRRKEMLAASDEEVKERCMEVAAVEEGECPGR